MLDIEAPPDRPAGFGKNVMLVSKSTDGGLTWGDPITLIRDEDPKLLIASLTPAVIAERARAAVSEMNGRALLLGPDCSINPDTPEAMLDAAREALEAR